MQHYDASCAGVQNWWKEIPTPHDFRRAFALQKLMGHSDLQILQRYLAQTDQDIHTAHMRGSPVDSNL